MENKETVFRDEKIGFEVKLDAEKNNSKTYTITTISGKKILSGTIYKDSGIILHNSHPDHSGFKPLPRNYYVDIKDALTGLKNFNSFLETKNGYTKGLYEFEVAVANAISKDLSILDDLTPIFASSDEDFMHLVANRYIASQFSKYESEKSKAFRESRDLTENVDAILEESKEGIGKIKSGFEKHLASMGKVAKIEDEVFGDYDDGLVKGPGENREQAFKDRVLNLKKELTQENFNAKN